MLILREGVEGNKPKRKVRGATVHKAELKITT
jgi:hypothetical protein